MAGLNNEQARLWYDPDLDNLELLRATYVSHVFTLHAHSGFAIGVIESGGQAFTYQRSTHLLMPAGSIAIINPAVVHTGRAATTAGWSYRMLYPSAALLESAASQALGRVRETPFFPSPVIQDDNLSSAFDIFISFLKTQRQRGSNASRACCGRLHNSSHDTRRIYPHRYI